MSLFRSWPRGARRRDWTWGWLPLEARQGTCEDPGYDADWNHTRLGMVVTRAHFSPLSRKTARWLKQNTVMVSVPNTRWQGVTFLSQKWGDWISSGQPPSTTRREVGCRKKKPVIQEDFSGASLSSSFSDDFRNAESLARPWLIVAGYAKKERERVTHVPWTTGDGEALGGTCG